MPTYEQKLGEYMKLEYKILVCDDNDVYLNQFLDEINKANSLNKEYYLKVYIGKTRSECMALIRENTYDIIILDVCIKSESSQIKTYSDIIRSSTGVEYYGVDLYKLIPEHNPTAKVFVVSNLPIMELKSHFNYADLNYFCKSKDREKQVVRYIKNYFDTGKERIFNNVFIVYGHNQAMRSSVENHIKSLGLNSIDLFNQSPGGLYTVYDALSECANTAECAIILLSADDIIINTENLQMKYRARQNVIFEMGLFAGHLGRDKVIVLYQKHDQFELPSDVNGVFYIEYNDSDSWKDNINKSLKKIGFNI